MEKERSQKYGKRSTSETVFVMLFTLALIVFYILYCLITSKN